MKKISFLFLTVLFLLSVPVLGMHSDVRADTASASGAALNISAKSAVLIEGNTGEILY